MRLIRWFKGVFLLFTNVSSGNCLTEGSVYTLSGFDVTRSNPKLKLTDGPVSIRFNEGTAFEKLAATARTIPTEHKV
ncbi:unnamed protein product [Brassica oleracea var. botrytis]